MQTFVDQMGRRLRVDMPPKRIISLVPSQTELLHYLGLDKEVIGITKFCAHPLDWHKHKTKVGGTKKLRLESIKKLKPDLIIGNKEENTPADIQKLAHEFPVWMSDVVTLQDAYDMIQAVGDLVGKAEHARTLVQDIQSAFEELISLADRRVAYFIWKRPYMVAGSNTFIDTILETWGADNVFGSISRYPEIKPADLKNRAPELIILSTEPYPFKPRHIHELQKICPDAKVVIADGKYFSWYGNRLLDTPAYLNKLKEGLNG